MNDYDSFMELTRTYIQVLERFSTINNLLDAKMSGIVFKDVLRVECNPMVTFRQDNVLVYNIQYSFVSDSKDYENSTADYSLIKMSNKKDCNIYTFEFSGLPTRNVLHNVKGLHQNEANVTYCGKQLPRLVSKIDDFTEEMHFQYSTMMDDEKLFMYVLSLCTQYLNNAFVFAPRTDYYNYINLESALKLLDEMDTVLSSLK